MLNTNFQTKQVDRLAALEEIIISSTRNAKKRFLKGDQYEEFKQHVINLSIITKMRLRIIDTLKASYYQDIKTLEKRKKSTSTIKIINKMKGMLLRLKTMELRAGRWFIEMSRVSERTGIKYTENELRTMFSIPKKQWDEEKKHLESYDILSIIFVANMGDEAISWSVLKALIEETDKIPGFKEKAFDKFQEMFGPIPTYTAATDGMGNILSMKPNKPNLKIVKTKVDFLEVDK